MSAPTPDAIVAAARRWIGTPYMHQAATLGAGCDCLGLLRGVWRELYASEPEEFGPYTADWAEASRREDLVEAARRHLVEIGPPEAAPGDVLLFRWRDGLPAKHIAILSAAGRMIHAHDGAGVAEVHLVPSWRRRVSHAFRFPPNVRPR
jgi:NlpC/P60 family putative phage cell wall peptidase